MVKYTGCLHLQAITTASSMELGWLKEMIAGPFSVFSGKPHEIFLLTKNNKLHRASNFIQ